MEPKIAAGLARRDAISRAELFLVLAEQCGVEHRDLFEAYLEASIVFGRTAIHRVHSEFKQHSECKVWFASLKGNAAIEFFRAQRDFILKEGPPRVGQIISGTPIKMARELYYFESADIPATNTVRRYLQTLATLLQQAKAKFVAG